MVIVSFLGYTIYIANKHQYISSNFDFLKLTAILFLLLTYFLQVNFLCAFQFPMCDYYIACAPKHSHRLEDTQMESMILYSENGGTTINF